MPASPRTDRRAWSPLPLALAAAAVAASACDFSASKRMAGESACQNARSYADAARPFHTVRIDGENDFDPATERFPTGTEGYDAYLTWDECSLFIGYSGPALGAGDCPAEGECPVERQGASPFKYLILYVNTGPRGGRGAGGAQHFGLQDWSLPFRANYLVAVRTDGSPVPGRGGEMVMENVQVYQWTKIWSSSLRREWDPVGARMVEVRGNQRTGFVEMALDLSAVGSPCAVEAIGWIADTEHHASYAYWPSRALPVPVWTISPDSVRTAIFRAAAGRPGAVPDTGTADPAADSAPPPPQARDSARRPPDPLRLLHRFGFQLVDSVAPNDPANLDRISYRRVGDCAEGP